MKSFTQRWRDASDEAEDQPMDDTPTDSKEAPEEQDSVAMQLLKEAIDLRAALAAERADRLQAERDEANESVDLNYKTILALREQIEELKRDNYEVRRERDQAIELRNQRTAELDAAKDSLEKERAYRDSELDKAHQQISNLRAELDAVRKERDEWAAECISANRIGAERYDAAQAKCAELEKLIQDASAWRPIETAPKDGTRILIASPSGVESGYWTDKRPPFGSWVAHNGSSPRAPHSWQPLPAPPEEKRP